MVMTHLAQELVACLPNAAKTSGADQKCETPRGRSAFELRSLINCNSKQKM